MDWAEDLKFSLKGKSTAKKGRRAAAAAASSTSSQDPSLTSVNEQSSIPTGTGSEEKEIDISVEVGIEVPHVPPRSKKSGLWADDVTKSGKTKQNTSNLIEQERFLSSTTPLSDDEIPIIPDLDDIQDEILMNDVVEAPSVSVNRVAAYKELNSDLSKQMSLATLEDIDLSILAKCLQNEVALNEPDDVWTWEQLFTEVTAEIHADKQSTTDLETQYVN